MKLEDMSIEQLRDLAKRQESALMQAQEIAQAANRQAEAKQAEIDRLMLEYCPDEMSAEQMSTWEANQRVAPQQHAQAAQIEIEGCGSITDEDDGVLTLRFVSEQAAQQFMMTHMPTVDCLDMPRPNLVDEDSRVTGNAQAALSDEQRSTIEQAANALEYHDNKFVAERLRIILATRQPAPVLSSGGEKPAGFAKCPISGREFWGNIDHPELGMIATYGGPYDTYSIPYLDEDDELRVERFDQDRGEWIEGGEPFGWFYSEQQPEAAHVASTPENEKVDCDDSLLLCVSDMEHSATYDSPREMVECLRAIAKRVKSLASPQPAAAPVAAAVQGDAHPLKCGTTRAERDAMRDVQGDAPHGNWPEDYRDVLKNAEAVAHQQGRAAGLEEIAQFLERDLEACAKAPSIINRLIAAIRALNKTEGA